MHPAQLGSVPKKDTCAGSDLRARVRIQFQNSQGLEEAGKYEAYVSNKLRLDASHLTLVGIDGGGVFKEFLTELTQRAYDPNYGMFKESPENRLYPNPASGVVNGRCPGRC